MVAALARNSIVSSNKNGISRHSVLHESVLSIFCFAIEPGIAEALLLVEFGTGREKHRAIPVCDGFLEQFLANSKAAYRPAEDQLT